MDPLLCRRFFDNCPVPKLSEDRRQLDVEITKEEVTRAVNKLQTGKAPGPDGFPAEFFQKFLPILVDPLTNMLKESLETGTLPYSMEMATINVFLKPDKDQCNDITFLGNEVK